MEVAQKIIEDLKLQGKPLELAEVAKLEIQADPEKRAAGIKRAVYCEVQTDDVVSLTESLLPSGDAIVEAMYKGSAKVPGKKAAVLLRDMLHCLKLAGS